MITFFTLPIKVDIWYNENKRFEIIVDSAFKLYDKNGQETKDFYIDVRDNIELEVSTCID